MAPERISRIRTLVCPLNRRPENKGPWNSGGIISTGGYWEGVNDERKRLRSYPLTTEEIRLFEKLAPLPKPDRKEQLSPSQNN